MPKKLINFEDSQIEAIDEWSNKYRKTFTEAVRLLVDAGLGKEIIPDEPMSITLVGDGLLEQVQELTEKVEKLSWWTSDDNTSRMGNIELKLEELEKHINVLTKVSKLFKAHISMNDIHLQDS